MATAEIVITERKVPDPPPFTGGQWAVILRWYGIAIAVAFIAGFSTACFMGSLPF